MNAVRLGVFSVAFASITAFGSLEAVDLAVTISPNPVEANASATVKAVANGPTCPDAEFDFGDGTRAKVTRAGTGFVAKHAWSGAGKHVVKVVAGPAILAGRVTCGPPVAGSTDVTVRLPLVNLDFAVGSAGLARPAILPTPGAPGDGSGGPKVGVPERPLTIEFVPPSPAANSLLVVKVGGFGMCESVAIDYGDGGHDGAPNANGSGGNATFYHSYAKAGTYTVTAKASSQIHCYVLPGTAKVTVQ